jgi:rare lipoprotein A (peptidoglycan hydrolase)
MSRISTPKRGMKTFILCAACAAALTLPAIPSVADNPKQRVDRLRSKRVEVTQRYEELSSAIDRARERIRSRQQEVILASEALNRKQEELHRELLAFNNLVRIAYKYGPGLVGAVLESRSLGEAGVARRYIGDRIEGQAKVVDRLVQINAQIAELSVQLENEQQLLEAELETLMDALDETARLLADTEAALAAAEEELRFREQMAKALQLLGSSGSGRYLARHRIATERQAEILARYPFGSVEGIPSGLRATGQTIEGIASWYGPGFNGLPTASGAIYDENLFTCASKELPLGTILLVTYKDRSVLLFVNDRGPFVPGRVLDLSRAAKEALGMGGLGYVVAQVLEPV